MHAAREVIAQHVVVQSAGQRLGSRGAADGRRNVEGLADRSLRTQPLACLLHGRQAAKLDILVVRHDVDDVGPLLSDGAASRDADHDVGKVARAGGHV